MTTKKTTTSAVVREFALPALRARVAELDAEKERVRRAIESLTRVRPRMAKAKAAKRRPKLTAQQRAEIGDRMRKYWAARRKAAGE